MTNSIIQCDEQLGSGLTLRLAGVLLIVIVGIAPTAQAQTCATDCTNAYNQTTGAAFVTATNCENQAMGQYGECMLACQAELDACDAYGWGRPGYDYCVQSVQELCPPPCSLYYTDYYECEQTQQGVDSSAQQTENTCLQSCG
jgi:hypothetical protein